jgi:hypothetical protein
MKLDVTINMNSSVASILAFKCCNVADQNLEVIVTNRGEQVTGISNRIELEESTGSRKTMFLYPPQVRKIAPGDLAAYYGSMDEIEWRRYQTMMLFDEHGQSYPVSIAQPESVDGSGRGRGG